MFILHIFLQVEGGSSYPPNLKPGPLRGSLWLFRSHRSKDRRATWWGRFGTIDTPKKASI